MRRIASTAVLSVLLAAQLATAAEDQDSLLPRVVNWKISPAPTMLMVCRMGGEPSLYLPEGERTPFLAAPGDLVMVAWEDREAATQPALQNLPKPEGSFIICLGAQDAGESSFVLDPASGLMRQDGKIIGLLADKDGKLLFSETTRTAVARLTPQELRTFRFAALPPAKDAASQPTGLAGYTDLLRRILAANPPGLLLVAAEQTGADGRAFGGAKPRALHIDGPVAPMLQRWAGKETRHLIINHSISTRDFDALAKLDGAKTLQIWNKSQEDAVSLPENLKLQGLTWAEAPESLKGLGNQKQLTQLAIPAKLLEKLDLRRSFPRLVSLSTTVSELSSVPAGLAHLRLVEDKGVTADLLRRIVEANPGLTTLEFADCCELTDLSPLRKLKKLTAIQFIDTEVKDQQTLAEMKTLHFIGMPRQKDDDAALRSLRAARPDAVVVAVDGFCLGSGWLLLTVPAVAAAAVVARRRRRDHA